MAVSDADKLTYFNSALTSLLGQEPLASISEDRPPQYYLNSAYDLGAVNYCLEVTKPVFARKTAKLATPAVSTDHDLDSVHTLPTIISVYCRCLQ